MMITTGIHLVVDHDDTKEVFSVGEGVTVFTTNRSNNPDLEYEIFRGVIAEILNDTLQFRLDISAYSNSNYALIDFDDVLQIVHDYGVEDDNSNIVATFDATTKKIINEVLPEKMNMVVSSMNNLEKEAMTSSIIATNDEVVHVLLDVFGEEFVPEEYKTESSDDS